MRLIHAETYKLEEFTDETTPRYAILSHMWGVEEISMQDVGTESGARKKGFAKIAAACKQTVQDQLSYIWIDTCCIDRSSSAELSEAINSMFNWYQRADKCYAYLEDVALRSSDLERIKAYGAIMTASQGAIDHRLLDENDITNIKNTKLAQSRWFTRGWTLQELIAPRDVLLYGADWKFIGTKNSLARMLNIITAIDQEVLLDPGEILGVCIARKMSWAAYRKTTRPEDMAYCLLGIFDINMPLLYGEGGRKAFIRLQEEIVRTTEDHSIFAWQNSLFPHTGLLAPELAGFKQAGKITRWESGRSARSFTLTSAGLNVTLPFLRTSENTALAVLSCRYEDDFRGPIALKLYKNGLDGSFTCGGGLDSRLTILDSSRICIAEYKDILIRHRGGDPSSFRAYPRGSSNYRNAKCWVRWRSPRSWKPFVIYDFFPSSCWNKKTATLSIAGAQRVKGAIHLNNGLGNGVVVAFQYPGTIFPGKRGMVEWAYTWVSLVEKQQGTSLEETWLENASTYSDLTWVQQSASLILTGPIKVVAKLESASIMGESVFVVDIAFLELEKFGTVGSDFEMNQLLFGTNDSNDVTLSWMN